MSNLFYHVNKLLSAWPSLSYLIVSAEITADDITLRTTCCHVDGKEGTVAGKEETSDCSVEELIQCVRI